MFETNDSNDSTGPKVRRETPREASSAGVVRHIPADIRHRRFSMRFRGYDQIEVWTFLTELADDLEQALHEIRVLQGDLSRLDEALAEHRTREQTLRDTLLTAQTVADELRAKAEVEARAIVEDAEARADLLIEKAQLRMQDIEREMEELRNRRREMVREIEQAVGTTQRAIDEVRSREGRDSDDRLRLMRPRRQSEDPSGETDTGGPAPELDGRPIVRRQGET